MKSNFMIGSDEHPHTEDDVWEGDFTFEDMPPGAWISWTGRRVGVNDENDDDCFIRQNNCRCPFCAALRVRPLETLTT